MKRRTRKLLLNIATSVAIAATAAVVLLPAAASAAPATTTSNVNVRQGPGTSYAAVGVIATGEFVDVRQCSGGWCLINGRGLDGWVSQSYLNQRGGTTNLGPVNPGVNIQVPGISIGIGNNPPPPRPGFPPPGPGPRPPFHGGPGPGFGGGPGHGPGPGFGHRDAQACFYDGRNYSGRSFCLDEGESMGRLSRGQDIGSIDNRAGLRVRVCSDEYLRGDCRIYTSGSRDLGRFGDFVRSVSVD